MKKAFEDKKAEAGEGSISSTEQQELEQLNKTMMRRKRMRKSKLAEVPEGESAYQGLERC
ncbi:hypothetical protein INT80_11140 [Gallibacterium anatis]|uniref:Uncharacterized protein n=1 Tax=Gallibacterium anatis TaxID=750 RepID=A0A930UWU5_9PAST|nr:hypothetical protein [Gallibacterium anatis]